MLIEQPDADDVAGARCAGRRRFAPPAPSRRPPARRRAAGWRRSSCSAPSGRQDDLLALAAPHRPRRATRRRDRWLVLPALRRRAGPPPPPARPRVRAPGDAAAFAFGRLRDRLPRRARRGDRDRHRASTNTAPSSAASAPTSSTPCPRIFESDSELAVRAAAARRPTRSSASRCSCARGRAGRRASGSTLDARHALAAAAGAPPRRGGAGRRRSRARRRRLSRAWAAGCAPRCGRRRTAAPAAARPHAAGKLAAHRARTAHAARGLRVRRARPPAADAAAPVGRPRLGADPDGERLAYTFWERTLQGLRRPAGRRRGARR